MDSFEHKYYKYKKKYLKLKDSLSPQDLQKINSLDMDGGNIFSSLRDFFNSEQSDLSVSDEINRRRKRRAGKKKRRSSGRSSSGRSSSGRRSSGRGQRRRARPGSRPGSRPRSPRGRARPGSGPRSRSPRGRPSSPRGKPRSKSPPKKQRPSLNDMAEYAENLEDVPSVEELDAVKNAAARKAKELAAAAEDAKQRLNDVNLQQAEQQAENLEQGVIESNSHVEELKRKLAEAEKENRQLQNEQTEAEENRIKAEQQVKGEEQHFVDKMLDNIVGSDSPQLTEKDINNMTVAELQQKILELQSKC